ncbi:hypothetical protein CDAR_595921 [Caerostris darwini]|uniref:Uncharacterized protein n=1 Tax=Caerostris darwini TaxID=1538125 RepID=A0AAV4Q6E5_9ARAC|nr:hypothetical protein CDAR_595921 [Caerostris darwini]
MSISIPETHSVETPDHLQPRTSRQRWRYFSFFQHLDTAIYFVTGVYRARFMHHFTRSAIPPTPCCPITPSLLLYPSDDSHLRGEEGRKVSSVKRR